MKAEETVYIKYTKGPIFNMVPTKLRKFTLHEFIRWFMQLPFGYIVGTMFVNEVEIGYTFLSHGGNPRYPFASRKDLVIGPYFILPEYRGHNYAAQMLDKCLSEIGVLHNAWVFIDLTNLASIKTAEAVGFEYAGDVKYSKYLRILKLCEENISGEMRLYRKGEV